MLIMCKSIIDSENYCKQIDYAGSNSLPSLLSTYSQSAMHLFGLFPLFDINASVANDTGAGAMALVNINIIKIRE